ncbi:hypothetical protein D1AOALGA4SA_8660 [Olavius algarvensis Delta 1 endosymbiont]|nr:hypothetical protein D1AOALGA4SA_8660 [Olavius algarvensis Delta 1 endosymbiont]
MILGSIKMTSHKFQISNPKLQINLKLQKTNSKPISNNCEPG